MNKPGIVYVLICIMAVLNFACTDEAPTAQKFHDFKVHNFVVLSAERNGSSGFILNCQDRIVRLTSDGLLDWQLFHTELYEKNPSDTLRIAQTISDPNSADIFVFGSIVNPDTHVVKLVAFKLSNMGDVLWKTELNISDSYENKPPRSNEEFYMQENNYPIVAINEESIVIAFSYDEQAGVRAKYRLMKLNSQGVLFDSKTLDMGDFYGRVYKVFITSSSDIVLSRGGRNWFVIETFNTQLNVKESQRIKEIVNQDGVEYAAFGDPILNNIIELTSGELVFTGHLDVLNNINTNFITNFDHFIVTKNQNELRFATYGLNEYKELSFYSYLSNEQSIKLVGVKRGLNELIQDVDSDLLLLDLNQSGELFDQQVLMENQGFEGVFSFENSDGSLTILGTKTGFTNKQLESFFITLNPDQP